MSLAGASLDDYFKRISDSLVELKDTSELAMDLAYSALLLNSREIAEEAIRLEEAIDRMHTEFELLVLSTCVRAEDSKGFLGLIRMGVVTENIADAAREIAEVVLRGVEPHPVLKMVIEGAEETVKRVVVARGAPVRGKTLKEARIPENTGMWILVIRRGDRWIRPRPGTALEEGDVLIASGYAGGENDFQSLVAGGPPSRRRR